MYLADIEVLKEDNKIMYFPYILTGTFKGINKVFTNKNDLKEYLKNEGLTINKILHINYDLECNQLPF